MPKPVVSHKDILPKMHKRLEELPEVKPFFAMDFKDIINDSKWVSWYLRKLVKKGEIGLVFKGMYYKPRHTQFGDIRPNPEDIACAIGRKNHYKVTYTTAWWENMLGLSTQVPCRYQFLTSGPTKIFEWGNWSGTMMKHKGRIPFAFENELMGVIALILQEHKKYYGAIETQWLTHMQWLIKVYVKDEDVLERDLQKMPRWMAELITNKKDFDDGILRLKTR